MRKLWQSILLATTLLALIVLLVEIGLAISATQHGERPARIVQVQAGPYPLTIELYKYPAEAGFALPFSIVPQQNMTTRLEYEITSEPTRGISATPIRSSISAQVGSPNRIDGEAELPVKGTWNLDIRVSGEAGQSQFKLPIEVSAPTPIPLWSGWLIGLIPLYGLAIFLFSLRKPHPSANTVLT